MCWYVLLVSAVRRQKQGDYNFDASLGYLVRGCLKSSLPPPHRKTKSGQGERKNKKMATRVPRTDRKTQPEVDRRKLERRDSREVDMGEREDRERHGQRQREKRNRQR